jgi:hypothetical protein
VSELAGAGSWAGGWDEPGVLSIVLIAAGTPGSGLFVYSAAPAAGNLIESIAATGGTDLFGNTYLAGHVTYGPGPVGQRAATQLSQQTLGYYLAPSASGAYVLKAQIFFNGSGNITLEPVSTGVIQATQEIVASVPGSPGTAEVWNPMTLLNSWANVGGFAVAQYRKVASPPNSVEIVCALDATSASAATFFTLPAGYVPASSQPVCAMGENLSVPAGRSPWVKCDTSGNLSVQNTGALGAWEAFFHGFISLDA